MNIRIFSSIAVLALLFGFASSALAQDKEKSWEVDLYGNNADVTYIDDGYDDIHVYDHNNPRNDRSYIAVDDGNSYGYGSGYRYGNHQGRYDNRRYDNRGYGHYDSRRAYIPRDYRPTRYELRYHHPRRGYGYGYRGW